MKPFLLFCTLCLVTARVSARTDTVRRIHADLPYPDGQKQAAAGILSEGPALEQAILKYDCYKYAANGDSLLICRKEQKNLALKEGARETRLVFSSSDGPAWCLPIFRDILRKTGSMPPGSYKVFASIGTDSAVLIRQVFRYQVDSELPEHSPLRQDLSSILAPAPEKNAFNGLFGRQRAFARNTARTLDRSAGKMERLLRAQGLARTREQQGDKEYISLFYQDWFLGRYELSRQRTLDSQLDAQKARLGAPVTSLVTNELEGYRSLLTQVRDMTLLQKPDRELKGELALGSSWSNGQPEYSQQDNNYYELRGNIETSIGDIPIGIEGYYTTQDRNRSIKASYIRVRYDAQRAKDELLQLMGGFREQFSRTLSKGKGLDQVYGSYLAGLRGESGQLTDALKQQTGLYDLDLQHLDTNALRNQIEEELKSRAADTTAAGAAAQKIEDAGARARRVADSANRVYNRAMEQYRRLQALQEKAARYQALLEQYRNTAYFDSTLGYARLKDLGKGDATTYRQLAQQASGFLPEGKVKRAITGLTSLDLGIFPKDISRYTMAGQQLKGMDIGYDLGFCQVGATYGSVEFAGRDGTLDKYPAYSGRATFMPLDAQKLTLVYYGYSPSKSALQQDTFFKNTDIALPSFAEPVHILSAAYEGNISSYVRVEGEIASSFRKGSDEKIGNSLDAERIAWHLNAEGTIPKTTLALQAGYEHGGLDFRNSTLPLSLSGTDVLRLGVTGDLFRSFLTLGIEYNRIEQRAFSGTGTSNRWGFELSTHSRKWPSVSLSYKPYTTFRSYTDTLAVPQRPLLGAVWTGRANYQLRRHDGNSWRFTAVYNKSTSEIDTSHYSSDLMQLNVIYTARTWMLTGSVGNTDQTANDRPSEVPAHVRTIFGMLSGTCPLSKQASLSGGTDLGFAAFGLSRCGVNTTLAYRFEKVPFAVRGSARWSKYRLSAEGWKELYSGSIDLVWQLKMKLKNRK